MKKTIKRLKKVRKRWNCHTPEDIFIIIYLSSNCTGNKVEKIFKRIQRVIIIRADKNSS